MLAGDKATVAGHHDTLPVVQASGSDLTQGVTRDLDIGILLHDLLVRLLVAHGIDLGIVLVGVVGLDAQHGLEVLLALSLIHISSRTTLKATPGAQSTT